MGIPLMNGDIALFTISTDFFSEGEIAKQQEIGPALRCQFIIFIYLYILIKYLLDFIFLNLHLPIIDIIPVTHDIRRKIQLYILDIVIHPPLAILAQDMYVGNASAVGREHGNRVTPSSYVVISM